MVLIYSTCFSSSRAISNNSVSLQCPGNTPRGVYVSTDEQDPLGRCHLCSLLKVSLSDSCIHLEVLHGVVFQPSSGPFSGGVFRFSVQWGSTSSSDSAKTAARSSTSKPYVSNAPTVTFNQGLNHPLIHVRFVMDEVHRAFALTRFAISRLHHVQPSTHVLSLAPRFPAWRPRSDTLSHLLYYIRDCFGWKLLEDVKPREGWWTNAEMGR